MVAVYKFMYRMYLKIVFYFLATTHDSFWYLDLSDGEQDNLDRKIDTSDRGQLGPWTTQPVK
jgi:hypothetical protein